MKTVKRRIFSGVVCEQIVYNIREGVNTKTSRPKRARFNCEEERIAHKLSISRRHHARLINDNFVPGDLYITLTFDLKYELHDFEDARRVRDNFVRRLLYKYPEAKIAIYMGRGKSTARIHFHMICHGIDESYILKQWKYGRVRDVRRLRAHNTYDGVDHGADFTGLANYLFDHWTPEIGGHRYKMTKNIVLQKQENATECTRAYSVTNPPQAPRGYILVEIKDTPYGYLYFKYVKDVSKNNTSKVT